MQRFVSYHDKHDGVDHPQAPVTSTAITTTTAGATTRAPTIATPTPISVAPAPAEVVYRNVTILTMDPAEERADAVAVADGIIVAVGSWVAWLGVEVLLAR